MNGQKGTRGAGCARAHRQGASEPARSVSEAVWGMFCQGVLARQFGECFDVVD